MSDRTSISSLISCREFGFSLHKTNQLENLYEKARVSGGGSPAIRSVGTGSANAYAVLAPGAAVKSNLLLDGYLV